jgi:hypothetical protein
MIKVDILPEVRNWSRNLVEELARLVARERAPRSGRHGLAFIFGTQTSGTFLCFFTRYHAPAGGA